LWLNILNLNYRQLMNIFIVWKGFFRIGWSWNCAIVIGHFCRWSCFAFNRADNTKAMSISCCVPGSLSSEISAARSWKRANILWNVCIASFQQYHHTHCRADTGDHQWDDHTAPVPGEYLLYSININWDFVLYRIDLF